MDDRVTPYYDLVPKDPEENLDWRIRCREKALVDQDFQDMLWQACMDDVLFFMGFACWAYDPRATAETMLAPFIPWPHQEGPFVKMDEAFDIASERQETIDVLLDKARAQGGTFGYLWIDLQHWLRDRMFSAGYVTRNEDLIDSKTDKNTVLWKIQFALDLLPEWMVPNYERNLGGHTFENKDNGAILKGYAAGQDVAAGGRATVFTMDEAGTKDFVAGGKDYAVMEALHDVTNYLRLVSARYIDQGVFHEACEASKHGDADDGGMHLILDWKDHPVHGKYKYIVTDNKPAAIDPADQEEVGAYHAAKPDLRTKLERKGFKYEGRVRSPWYDMRCLRKTATPQLVASQLDRDPRGAVGKVFPSSLLDEMQVKECRPPLWRGQPVFDGETYKLTGLIPRDDGPLELWFKPSVDNMPPFGPFTIGCDMALGSDGAYSSNSVACGIDDTTGEQVMQYTIKGMALRDFGRVSVGLAMWLRDALLGWEDSGMSGQYANEVMQQIRYHNVFFRDVPEHGSRKKTRKPGWTVRNEDKQRMFETAMLAMVEGKFKPRSSEMVTECGEYEWEKGVIIHGPTKNKGNTEKNHGDRCIAACGAWLVFANDNAADSIDTSEETGQTPEWNSFKWREDQEEPQAKRGSPQWSIRDIARRYS